MTGGGGGGGEGAGEEKEEEKEEEEEEVGKQLVRRAGLTRGRRRRSYQDRQELHVVIVH